MCSASHRADVETIIELVPNFVQSDGSHARCDSHKWILGWVEPCEIVCEMHVAQLLLTLHSLTANHTNSSVVGKSFSKLVASSGGAEQRSQSPGSLETKL
jgi:hypothetical protein